MVFGGFVVQAAERGEPVRLTRGLLALVAREAVARAMFVSLWALQRAVAPPERVPPPEGVDVREVPVLLVPGHGLGPGAMGFLRTFLLRRGFTWVWCVDLAPRADLAGHAAHLGRHVEALCRASGAERIDVVGFSLGGLAAAWYVRHLEGSRRVRRLVTIGTPWAGTRLAVFRRSRVARELLPGSHVLDGLVPPPVPTVCIWSPDDPTVVPASSAAPDRGAESVRVDSAGHVEMLVSARIFRAVQAGLTHPLPEVTP